MVGVTATLRLHFINDPTLVLKSFFTFVADYVKVSSAGRKELRKEIRVLSYMK